jgi:hypothetical protein
MPSFNLLVQQVCLGAWELVENEALKQQGIALAGQSPVAQLQKT